MAAKKETKLDQLKEINEHLEKITSFSHSFKRGIVRGLGVAIGASIIAAISLSLLAALVDTVDDVPIIEDIIEQSNIKEPLNEQQGTNE